MSSFSTISSQKVEMSKMLYLLEEPCLKECIDRII